MHRPKIDLSALWIRYKSTNSRCSRNKIIEHYYPLVKKIAYQVAEKLNWKASPDELCSWGIDGLYRAIDLYDLARKIKFESYASRRIKGSMYDGLRQEDVVPRSVRINNNRFSKARQKMQAEKGRGVSETEVIKKMGIAEGEFLRNTKKYIPVAFMSIEGSGHVAGDTENDIPMDTNISISDWNSPNPDRNLRKAEFWHKITGQDFTAAEQKIIYYYYYEHLTMEEIAGKLNKSESRISQIHKKLLSRLKERILENPEFFISDHKKYFPPKK